MAKVLFGAASVCVGLRFIIVSASKPTLPTYFLVTGKYKTASITIQRGIIVMYVAI